MLSEGPLVEGQQQRAEAASDPSGWSTVVPRMSTMITSGRCMTNNQPRTDEFAAPPVSAGVRSSDKSEA